jgi:xanthine dehydrogenase accessory factor
MGRDLSRAAEELSAARVPFVVATVVRVAKPASVRPGDAAIVHRDGRIEGFVGGACSTSTVRLHALRVLETEEPLLLRIRPLDDEGTTAEGVVTVGNPCLSGGELEIFLEPRLPAPLLRVIGDSPVGAALARLGTPLGFEVVAGGTPEPGDAACVVASHGDTDEGAVEAALLAGVPYVGLVASPRRGAAVVERLGERGICETAVGRLRTPAGLDIGSRTHAEVALSILAEIVQLRAQGPLAPAVPATEQVRADLDGLVDPVCGMVEPPGAGWPRVEHEGTLYAFCCAGCQRRFEGDPERFLAST